MSNKSLVTLCIVIAMMIAMTNALFSISGAFTADKIVRGQSAIVQFKFSQIAQIDGLTLVYPSPTDVYPPPEYWTFDTNELSPIEGVLGHSDHYCWDDVTKQNVFKIVHATDSLTFSDETTFWSWSLSQVSDPLTLSWTINCPVRIDIDVVPTNTSLKALYDGSDVTVTLAMPAKGFVSPSLFLKTAAISQVHDDPLTSSAVVIEFTTDTIGVYSFGLKNGPVADPINHNDATFADFYCKSGTNKEFARVQYVSGSIHVFVTEATAKDIIKCTFLFTNYNPTTFVSSERITAQLTIGDFTASRRLDYKLTPAGVTASLTTGIQDTLDVDIVSTLLPLSGTPVNINSTIIFKFSKHIGVGMVQLKEDPNAPTSYQANQNCAGFRATSFVNPKDNTIILRDVLSSTSQSSVSKLDCAFNFIGSDVFKYQDSADMASVHVEVDGKSLVSTQSIGHNAPIYFETVGEFSAYPDHTQVEAGGKVTIVDTFEFHDIYETVHTYMRHPLLVIGILGQQTYAMENYEAQLTSCEATSPERTDFEALKLKFDPHTLTWSVKLDKLVQVDSYSILIRCTRVVNKMTKYGLDITPVSHLTLNVVNLLDTKRYYGSHAGKSSANLLEQTATQTGAYPGPTQEERKFTMTYLTTDLKPATVQLARDNSKVSLATQLTTTAAGFTYSSAYTTFSHEGGVPGYIAQKMSPVQFTDDNSLAQFLKSFTWSTLEVLSQLNRKSFDHYYSNVNHIPVDITETITVKPTTAGAAATWGLDTDEEKAFTKPTTVAKYGEANFMIAYKLNSQTSEIWSPYTGCGVDAGFAVAPPDGSAPTPDGTTVAPIGFDYVVGYTSAVNRWSAFRGASTTQHLCNIGEKCTINADCLHGSCSAGVCAQEKTYNPPFVQVSEAQTRAFDKAFFNSATMTSSIVAVIVVALAIVF